jgi:flagellar biogenesis protein FliO
LVLDGASDPFNGPRLDRDLGRTPLGQNGMVVLVEVHVDLLVSGIEGLGTRDGVVSPSIRLDGTLIGLRAERSCPTGPTWTGTSQRSTRSGLNSVPV